MARKIEWSTSFYTDHDSQVSEIEEVVQLRETSNIYRIFSLVDMNICYIFIFYFMVSDSQFHLTLFQIGEACCGNAKTTECHEACRAIFKSQLTPSREARSAVIESCSDRSPKVLQCVKNFTRVTPTTNPHRCKYWVILRISVEHPLCIRDC